MKEEKFTDKELERFANDQSASATWQYVKRLACELIEERKQPKVWDGAPNKADWARIEWRNQDRRVDCATVFKVYTRELPKTKAREIAEKVRNELRKYLFANCEQESTVDDIIESAILEYAKDNGSNT